MSSRESGRVNVFRRKVQQEDICLLCSGGLSDTVSGRERVSLLQPGIKEPLREWGERLAAAANQHGGRDHITVVLVSLNA